MGGAVRRLIWIAAAVVLLVAACTDDGGHDTSVDPVGAVGIGTAAPAFSPDLDWVNATGAVDSSGAVTLVHFWRQSCLSCLETLSDIAGLQAEFGAAVVGVHSPKFPRETSTDVVRGAVRQLEYPGPVVNDSDRAIWNAWGIQAWPTVAVIDADGNLAGGHVGLGAAEALRPLLADLVADASGATAIPTDLPDPAPTALLYPEAVLADPVGNRLFIADTGHHRIVVAVLDSYEVLAVIGTGTAGRSDGPAAAASLDTPRGMALAGSTLYVADSGNDLIRAVDLNSFEATTIAATGDTPWDIAATADGLLVSMAAANELVLVDPDSGEIRPYAGSGRLGVANGGADTAEFAMPAGLAVGNEGFAYVADAESGSIRSVASDGTTGRIAGGADGLFDIGDADGVGSSARLQHPLGVAVGGNDLWVADTYNSKIKRIDLATGALETLVGGEGWRDGPAPLFSAPAGLDLSGGLLYVADRDNHSVRIVDTDSGATETVILQGIERLVPADTEFDGTLLVLDPVDVTAGVGTLTLDVTFPPGYKANELAPSRFEWTAAGDAVDAPDAANVSIPGPAFPMPFDFTFAAGEGRLQGDVWLVYCESTAESMCLFDRVRIEVPLQVTSGGSSDVAVAYQVTLPDGL
jgi:DNA-binding beta-propeller fold protein YncE